MDARAAARTPKPAPNASPAGSGSVSPAARCGPCCASVCTPAAAGPRRPAHGGGWSSPPRRAPRSDPLPRPLLQAAEGAASRQYPASSRARGDPPGQRGAARIGSMAPRRQRQHEGRALPTARQPHASHGHDLQRLAFPDHCLVALEMVAIGRLDVFGFGQLLPSQSDSCLQVSGALLTERLDCLALQGVLRPFGSLLYPPALSPRPSARAWACTVTKSAHNRPASARSARQRACMELERPCNATRRTTQWVVVCL
jgi:hypothetical protein